MKEKYKKGVLILYQEYSKKYDEDMKSLRSGSGWFSWKMSFEDFAYTQTRWYKFKSWYSKCWLKKRYNTFKFRLEMIYRAIFNIDYFE